MPRASPLTADPRVSARSPWRLVLACGVLGLLTLGGSLGYALLEGFSFAEALYMTVITLSTVGFEEVAPLSPAGRWYTIGLIAAGIGTVFYTVATLAEFLIEGRLRDLIGRRQMERTIEALRDHVILCGFGRLGRVVAEKLEHDRASLVVIDLDPAAQSECDRRGYPFLLGSALEDQVLARAGIARARALVAATGSDSDNVYLALSAREANPDIQIHARAETQAGIHRLQLAGARQVVSPHQLGGLRIANAIVRPAVVEFLELAAPGIGPKIDLEEVALAEGSGVADLPLGRLPERGIHISVVAIKRGADPVRISPGPDDVLQAGDRVIAIGDRESLNRLASLAEAH